MLSVNTRTKGAIKVDDLEYLSANNADDTEVVDCTNINPNE